MTAAEAYKKVPEKLKLEVGDNYFALLRWESPDHGGSSEKPLLVCVTGETAIEVRLDGTFRQHFPAAAEGYFPFFDKLEKPRKDQVAKLLEQLIELVKK